MAGIDQFIQSAVGDLGVSEGAAKSGVGSILSALQSKSDSNDFQQLLGSIPGAEGLMGQPSGAAAATDKAGGGLMGAAAGLGGIGSALGGGSGGSALGLLGALQGAGLSADQLGPFVSKFVSFAKQSAGQALVGKLLGNVPEIGKLLG